jgi:hypothetical protein
VLFTDGVSRESKRKRRDGGKFGRLPQHPDSAPQILV